MTPEKRAFLDGLTVRFAAADVSTLAAEAFRTTIMPDWTALITRVRGAVSAELSALSDVQRDWLAVFEHEPALLGPLGKGRNENLHSRAIAWLLSRSDTTGDTLRAAWLRVVDAEAPVSGWRVTAELTAGNGCRVDLCVEVPGAWTCFVEAKVDSGERERQLPDYADALARRCDGKQLETTLVFLTLDKRPPTDDVECRRVSYEDLAVAFLPATSQSTPTARYLRLWLASVARDLYKYAHEGPVTAWPSIRQQRTLAWLRRAEPEAS